MDSDRRDWGGGFLSWPRQPFDRAFYDIQPWRPGDAISTKTCQLHEQNKKKQGGGRPWVRGRKRDKQYRDRQFWGGNAQQKCSPPNFKWEFSVCRRKAKRPLGKRGPMPQPRAYLPKGEGLWKSLFPVTARLGSSQAMLEIVNYQFTLLLPPTPIGRLQ